MQAVVHAIRDQIAVTGAKALQQQGERPQVDHGITDGDRLRHGATGFARAQANRWNGHHGLDAADPFATHHPPALRGSLGGHAEPSKQGGNDIVGMPLDVDGQLQQFFLAEGFTDERIGSHQSGDDGGGTAAQPPRWRHCQTDPGFQGHRFHVRGFPDPLSCPVDEVVGPTAQMTAFGALNNQFESLTAAFDPPHGKAVVEIEGGTKAVEARSEVGGGCRNIHNHFLTDARLRHP